MRFFLLCITLSAAAQDFQSEVRPLLQKRCAPCHTDAVRTAGLSIQSLESIGPRAPRILAAVQQTGDL